MPYKRSYKKKRSARRYGKRRKYKSKRNMSRRRRYRKPDIGTYLKVSSTAVPVVINNRQTPTNIQYVLTPDTYQHSLVFAIGEAQADQQDIIITNQVDADQHFFPATRVLLGTDPAFTAYSKLYKYCQVYKIVLKFYPAITQGGTLSSTDQLATQFSNAVSGQVTTDIARKQIGADDERYEYFLEYPSTLAGQSKSMSRKISRNHNILKPWTRTFVPSEPIDLQSNPKSEYQYKPRYFLGGNDSITLGDNNFIIRMKKPSIAGFAAPNLEGTEKSFPPLTTFVRYGTIQATAFIKFSTPFN